MTMIDKNNDADIKGKYERGVARRKSAQQRGRYITDKDIRADLYMTKSV